MAERRLKILEDVRRFLAHLIKAIEADVTVTVHCGDRSGHRGKLMVPGLPAALRSMWIVILTGALSTQWTGPHRHPPALPRHLLLKQAGCRDIQP